MDEIEKYKPLLENTGFIKLIDKMATKYNKLPTELLNELSIHEFNLNIAIMIIASIEDKNIEDPENIKATKKLEKIGFKRKIKKVSKQELELIRAKEEDQFKKGLEKLKLKKGK